MRVRAGSYAYAYKMSSSRGVSWEEAETTTLIAIWGDIKIQEELDGAKKKKLVYDKIATLMREKGYNRDSEQCKTKIKNLKSTYRSIKDHNNKSGNDKKTWPFYDQMDAVLGHRPASDPPIVLDACAGGISIQPSEEEHASECGQGKI